MKFKNTANGHIEERGASWLWTLLFGGLYFIAVGVWAPLLIWMILTATLYISMGAPATVLVLVMNVVFAIMASSLVRSSYLRKGWLEVTDDDSGAGSSSVAGGGPRLPDGVRKCPLCAEEIKIEAIKCKHCGSDVPPYVPEDENAVAESLGITKSEGMYIYGTYRYDKLRDAIAYARANPR